MKYWLTQCYKLLAAAATTHVPLGRARPARLSRHPPSSGRLSQPVNRCVPDLRDRACVAGDDHHVQVDEAMTAARVIRGDFRVRGQRFTGVRHAEMPDRAAR